MIFARHSDIMFSHGICPVCIKQTYGKLGEQMLARQKASGQHDIPQKTKESVEDDPLKEMRYVVDQAISENNPLAQDIEKIVNRYVKLLKRFDKIVSLSDSYQSQLRDFNLRLELMAHTDPLTGINNRGYFMELLNTELNRSRRNKRVFSILVLDIDHFKAINDTYGHTAGDEALRTMHQVFLKSELRKSDFFGRIGGEEFAIVLPETDLKGAAKVAEKVRGNIEKSAIDFQGYPSTVAHLAGPSSYRYTDLLFCVSTMRRVHTSAIHRLAS